MFPVISVALDEVCAMNHEATFAPEMRETVIDAIVAEFGHLRPAEIKHALTKSLTGAIPGAPESTYGKIGLEWIGKSLRAYNEYRFTALKRVRDKMPPLLPEYTGPGEEEIEQDFETMARAIYDAVCEGAEVTELALPEVLRYLQSKGYDLEPGRKRELYATALKIIEEDDRKRRQSLRDPGLKAVAKINADRSRPDRAKRRAMSIAARELMVEMKGKGVEL